MIIDAVDLSILRCLAKSAHSSAAKVGLACDLTPDETHWRLKSLEVRSLVTSRHDNPDVGRLHSLTADGRRAAGINNESAS